MIELILLSITVKTVKTSENRIKKFQVTEVSKSGFSRFLGFIIWKIPMYLINIHEDFMTS